MAPAPDLLAAAAGADGADGADAEAVRERLRTLADHVPVMLWLADDVGAHTRGERVPPG